MKKLGTVLSLIGLLIFATLTWAEEGKETGGAIEKITYTISQDYRCFYSKEILKRLAIGIGLAGGLANTPIDEEIQGYVQDTLRNTATDKVSESVKPFGEGAITIPLYAGVALFGEFTKDSKLGSTIGKWGKSSLRTILVGAPPMLFLQRATGASRPKEDGSRWMPFNDTNGVSGHSFMGAVPFLTAAKGTDNLYVKCSLYLGSMLCGLSRINDNSHYTSQAALGWWVAYLAASCGGRTEKEGKRLIVVPASIKDGMGALAILYF
jgi:hypothetical protein